MKLKLNTSMLQTLVAKAMKGASCNKMLPLTQLMSIELKDGKLTLTTTDATNYLYVSAPVEGENFYVVVQAEIFSKLISKLTCDTVEITEVDGKLEIRGNGKYYIELPLDEDGKLVVYPNPLNADFNPVESVDVQTSVIKLVLETAKASLATSLDVPCYTGYYVGNQVVTTDTYKMCGIKRKVFDTPVLINPLTMELLDMFTDDTVHVEKDDRIIVFKSDNFVVYGKLLDCINDYQIDAISGLLDEQYESSCTIAKCSALQLLDRLALFVGAYDKNCVNLTFSENGLTFTSKQANSVETIEYMSSNNFKPYTCSIDVEMLRSQIKSNIADSIEIQYGKDNAIKITDGDISQIIALMSE